MQHLLITGTIGSGKSQLCKKIIGNYYGVIKLPAFYIDCDAIIRKWHKNTNIQKEFMQTLQKNGVVIPCYSLLKNILFYSPYKQKNRAWNSLDGFFHPRIQEYIKSICKSTAMQKGTIVWEAALSYVFPKKIRSITVQKKPLYPSLFLLRKYRKMKYRNALQILARQKMHTL